MVQMRFENNLMIMKIIEVFLQKTSNENPINKFRLVMKMNYQKRVSEEMTVRVKRLRKVN